MQYIPTWHFCFPFLVKKIEDSSHDYFLPYWCRVYLVETFLCFCSSFHSFLYLTFFHISDIISSFKTRSTFLQSHKLCQINKILRYFIKISQVTKNVKRLLNLLQGWRAIQIHIFRFEYISYKSYFIAKCSRLRCCP